jgi:membrane protease subunit HflC
VHGPLNNRFRDAQTLLGGYTFEELVSPDQDKNKLAEAEQTIKDRLQKDMTEPHDYGIDIVAVGIHRLELHKQVTPAVFNNMRKVRESLAQTARNEGNAKALEIKSSAERDRDIIMAFANRYAEDIRGEAIRNTEKIYEQFKEDEEFAIYLNQLEALKKTLQRNTTFILDTKTAPFDLFGKAKDEGKAGGTK